MHHLHGHSWFREIQVLKEVVVFEQMAFQNFASTRGHVQFEAIETVQGTLVGSMHVDQVEEPFDAALQRDAALQGGLALVRNGNEEEPHPRARVGLALPAHVLAGRHQVFFALPSSLPGLALMW